MFLRHFGGAHITKVVRERLDRAFAAAGLRADDHCVFLDRLSQSKFVAAAGLSDVFLDSIGWSGCNSALESLPHSLPIVTLPGAFMRGRHSAAILQMMGVTETIAADVDDYVAIAARLANNPGERQALRERMQANVHKVYRDRACVTALEDFLERAVRSGDRRRGERDRFGVLNRSAKSAASRQKEPAAAPSVGPLRSSKRLIIL